MDIMKANDNNWAQEEAVKQYDFLQEFLEKISAKDQKRNSANVENVVTSTSVEPVNDKDRNMDR